MIFFGRFSVFFAVWLALPVVVFSEGQSQLSKPRPHTSAYDIVDLGVLPGDTESGAFTINNNGDVLGQSSKGLTETDRSFFWDHRFRGMVPGYPSIPGVAAGMNDIGEIVGWIPGSGAAGLERGYVWSSGSKRMLQTPDAMASRAYGINNAGKIVGVVNSRNRDGALKLWRRGYRRIDLKIAVEPQHRCAINNNDEVLTVIEHFILGTPYSTTELAILRGGKIIRRIQPDSKVSYPGGMNDRGEIVGEADFGRRDSNGDTIYEVFLWRAGKTYRLNRMISKQSHWDLWEANGINNKGQIVGMGIHYGKPRAFLLNPVPPKMKR